MYQAKDCRTESFDTFRNQKKKVRKTKPLTKLPTEQYRSTFKKQKTGYQKPFIHIVRITAISQMMCAVFATMD